MKLLLELIGSIGNRFLRAAIMNDYHNLVAAARRKAADIFSLVNDTNCSFVLVRVCVDALGGVCVWLRSDPPWRCAA